MGEASPKKQKTTESTQWQFALVAVARNDTMGHLLEMWATLPFLGPLTFIIYSNLICYLFYQKLFCILFW